MSVQALFSQLGFIAFSHMERERECDRDIFTSTPQEDQSLFDLSSKHHFQEFVFLTKTTHPLLLSLLRTLTERLNVSFRQRKDELEQRMSSLQESRRELMVQLEGLMKLLKVTNTQRAVVLLRSAPHAAACVCPCGLPLHSFTLSNFTALTVPDFFLSFLFLSTCFCPCCGPVG